MNNVDISTSAGSAEQPREKRTWHYLQQPVDFEMAPCACGNHATQWSEFARHLWCDKCELDFIPEHNGIFDGPIAANVAHMLGVRFDRFNMATQQVERFNLDKFAYDAEEPGSVLTTG